MKRRVPLKANATPLGGYGKLRRSKPIRRKRPRRVDRDTPGDRAYVAWLHLRPCVGLRCWKGHTCWGGIQQSHERNMTGLGLKAPPRRSVPMCRSLHEQWEQHLLRFHGWSKAERREWMNARIEEENAAFERGEDASYLEVPF